MDPEKKNVQLLYELETILKIEEANSSNYYIYRSWIETKRMIIFRFA